VVDALNRRAHEVHISAIIMFNTNLKDKILGVENSYQQYIKIKETLQQGNLQQKFNNYESKEDGILMYKVKIYVLNSRELKNIVLKEMPLPSIYQDHHILSKDMCLNQNLYHASTMCKHVPQIVP